MSFRRKPAAPAAVRRVIIGLGNPGAEYRHTRHNLGFMVVDELARRLGARLDQKRDQALSGLATDPGDAASAVLLVKPQTFMNLSGRAAAAILRRHHLGPADMWAVYDELDLPLGKLRIREDGSPGGHNGVRSLIQELGTHSFVRFRLGVGRPGDDRDPVDHLLDPFHPDERQTVEGLISLAADAIIEALKDGLTVSMNRNNGRAV